MECLLKERDGPVHLRHALKRLWEHYHVRMSVSDLNMLKRKIARYAQTGSEKVEPVMQLGPGVSLWLVKFKNHWYPAVWHASFHEIMTFLPPDAYEFRSPREVSRRA